MSSQYGKQLKWLPESAGQNNGPVGLRVSSCQRDSLTSLAAFTHADVDKQFLSLLYLSAGYKSAQTMTDARTFACQFLEEDPEALESRGRELVRAQVGASQRLTPSQHSICSENKRH